MWALKCFFQTALGNNHSSNFTHTMQRPSGEAQVHTTAIKVVNQNQRTTFRISGFFWGKNAFLPTLLAQKLLSYLFSRGKTNLPQSIISRDVSDKTAGPLLKVPDRFRSPSACFEPSSLNQLPKTASKEDILSTNIFKFVKWRRLQVVWPWFPSTPPPTSSACTGD